MYIWTVELRESAIFLKKDSNTLWGLFSTKEMAVDYVKADILSGIGLERKPEHPWWFYIQEMIVDDDQATYYTRLGRDPETLVIGWHGEELDYQPIYGYAGDEDEDFDNEGPLQ